ncbi:MAG: 1-acylglycerol-3-phosphate O-acyltransferase, partial [Shewanella sp.]
HLNRWDNGVVIIEMMAPVPTAGLDKADVKALSAQIYDSMAAKLVEINQEASALMGKTPVADDV